MQTPEVNLENQSVKELLIFIPCHTDYEMALANVRRIRNQSNELSSSQTLLIKVAVSINGVNLSQSELDEIKKEVDHLYYFKESIGGDSNIAQGFMTALLLRPNYFWLLSSNEILVPGAIEYLSKKILTINDAEIIITNSKNRENRYDLSNVFVNLPPGLGLGFISGVIYDFAKIEFAFPAAMKFSWTGWGQLAVLQVACLKLGKLRVLEIPDSHIHETPFTFIENSGKGLKTSTEYEVVRSNYQHSFFGMPILLASLFSRNPKMWKLTMRNWVRRNWYKINYFSVGVEKNRNLAAPHFDTHWIRRISIPLFFRAGFLASFLTILGRYLKLEIFRKNKTSQKLLSIVKLR